VFANHGHRFYKVGADRAEAEVAPLDADIEVVSAMAQSIKYADALEPFDKERELKINQENRAVWQAEFQRTSKIAKRLWKLHEAVEWVAGVSLFLGFMLLMIFAVYNTYVQ
jgi:hypothetical protein